MTKQELKTLFSNNKEKASPIKSTELYNIMKFVYVSLNIDRDSLDYYYEMDVDELLNSEIPSEEFEVIKNQGWFFSEDGSKLRIFLKI